MQLNRSTCALGHGDQFTDSFSISSKKVSPSASKKISSIRLSRKTGLNLSWRYAMRSENTAAQSYLRRLSLYFLLL